MIIAFYMFIRDKYEKEPIYLLLVGIVCGVISSVPIIIIEKWIGNINVKSSYNNFYNSFIVAGMTEEVVKFVILYILIRRNKNFNERFDGIVYAVFISLGFALVENILYVTDINVGGVKVGIFRGIISVPAHVFYSIAMGYYFGLMKYKKSDIKYMSLSIIVPILNHGLFDYILGIEHNIWVLLFLGHFITMLISSNNMMKEHLKNSPFKSC